MQDTNTLSALKLAFSHYAGPVFEVKSFRAIGECNMRKRHNVKKAEPRTGPKIGRNEICPCGCGQKSKKCNSEQQQ